MQKTDHNQRRDFLKKIPIAMFSMSTLSILKFKKSKRYSEKKFNTLLKYETDKIIKKDKFSFSIRLKPEPTPLAQKSIKG